MLRRTSPSLVRPLSGGAAMNATECRRYASSLIAQARGEGIHVAKPSVVQAEIEAMLIRITMMEKMVRECRSDGGCRAFGLLRDWGPGQIHGIHSTPTGCAGGFACAFPHHWFKVEPPVPEHLDGRGRE